MDGVELGAVWNRALENSLDGSVEAQQRAWLSMTRPFGLVNDTVVLAAPNEFAKGILETKLRSLIAHALSRELGRPIRVAVMADPVVAAGVSSPGGESYPQGRSSGYPQGGDNRQGYTQAESPQFRADSGGPQRYPQSASYTSSSTGFPQDRAQAQRPIQLPLVQGEDGPAQPFLPDPQDQREGRDGPDDRQTPDFTGRPFGGNGPARSEDGGVPADRPHPPTSQPGSQ